MKITAKETKKLQSLLTVKIDRADANEKKEKHLKDVRRKAEIKGFRKGMAPMGLIEKLYGMSALQDAVNELVTDGINNYIKDNNLNLIGEPIPNEELQKPLDLEKDEEFEFVFDIATRPDVDVKFDKKDKVIRYNIKATAESLKKYKEDTLRQFGSLADAEKATEEDFMVVDFEQDGNKVEKTYVSLRTLDATSKKKFMSKKVGDTFEVDVVKSFPNETDRASLLRIKKEEFDSTKPLYNVTIKEIKTFKPAEESQDLYDRMFGKDKVKDSKGFENELKERLEADYKRDTEFRLRKDIVDFIVKKADIELPEEFLKRWLYNINEGKFTMEQIEKEFPLFLQDYRWQMIANKIFTEQKMKVEKDELLEQAKAMTASQFAMYGMTNIPEEQLNQYAQEILKNGKEINRIYEKCEEDKVLEYVKGIISIEDQEITPEELSKQMEKEATKDPKKTSKKVEKKEEESDVKKSTKKGTKKSE